MFSTAPNGPQNIPRKNLSQLANWGGASAPPIPYAPDVACWSTFGVTAGWQNDAAIIKGAGEHSAQELISSTATEPFPLNWATIIPLVGTNPALEEWRDQSGNELVINQIDDLSWAPDIDTTNKWFTLDGTQYVYTPSLKPPETPTLSLYWIFRTGADITTEQVLFQGRFSHQFGASVGGIFVAYIASSRLYVKQNNTDTVATFNSKRTAANLQANTTYIVSAVLDRDNATVNDQTLLFLNNSATGITQFDIGDMEGGDFNTENSFAVGMGNVTGSAAGFLGKMMHLHINNSADNSTVRTEWYDRLAYYVTEMGW